MLHGSLFLGETSELNGLICNLQDSQGRRGRLISEYHCFEASFVCEETFNLPSLHQKTPITCASVRSAPLLSTSAHLIEAKRRDSVLRTHTNIRGKHAPTAKAVKENVWTDPKRGVEGPTALWPFSFSLKRVKISSPQRGGSAVIRLSVCKHRMQKEETFKAEPKGMQINYVHIFLTDGTSMFQRGGGVGGTRIHRF